MAAVVPAQTPGVRLAIPRASCVSPQRHFKSSAGLSAFGLAAVARGCARLPLRRRVQRFSSLGGATGAPAYPGSGDTQKLLDFAHELCDFYRSSSSARLPITDVIDLLQDAQMLLQKEETLVRVQVPTGQYLNVVGDVHGQLFDFLSIFEANGWPSPENPFLFNGDFVDRGSYSIEIMLILLVFKLALPQHFFLSRGNHEEETMNRYYGFTGEVLAKYNAELAVWVAFQRVFISLPLAHVVNDDVFVTHGGLPRIPVSLAQIAALDRIQASTSQESKQEDVMIYNDLMWSDPCSGRGSQPSLRGGTARRFGPDITEDFLEKNGLSFVIRSHEVKEEGFEWMHDKMCLTVFSAPHYCDSGSNLGAVVRLHCEDDYEGLRPEILPFDVAEKPQDYVYAMSYVSATEALWPKALQKAGIGNNGWSD